MSQCRLDTCSRPTARKDLCSAHYQQQLRGVPFKEPRKSSRPVPEPQTCAAPECAAPAKVATYCGAHYARLRRHGDPLAGASSTHRTPEEAFINRVAWDGECLIWTGAITRAGYGHLYVGGKATLVHRYAWAREHGAIEEDFWIDHTCFVRACCLPAHLRLATPQQNNQNLPGARKGSNYPRGVTLVGRRYEARVVNNGTTHILGTFSTPGEAGRAAAAKRAELFGAFAGLGEVRR